MWNGIIGNLKRKGRTKGINKMNWIFTGIWIECNKKIFELLNKMSIIKIATKKKKELKIVNPIKYKEDSNLYWLLDKLIRRKMGITIDSKEMKKIIKSFVIIQKNINKCIITNKNLKYEELEDIHIIDKVNRFKKIKNKLLKSQENTELKKVKQ